MQTIVLKNVYELFIKYLKINSAFKKILINDLLLENCV